ncbi:NUDIX domain-containing protein [Pelagicoccus mobilis]|uniref:NUDIX domain-containing protein n=1 Tax=Pelagicoccus mobilis TaxID=415221 RepID=A0A934S450_9BACT|nr:NUDIX domain-containing protein [Pelagicoccus mobilis]MBK1880754.1 NUDIX domain-containing protein [Pelagicoccus mobilis]
MISEYYSSIRNRIGSDLLLIPSVACLVRDSEGKLLLQRKNDGTWSLPAGAIEPNEAPRTAAFRELKEETGIEATRLELVDVYGGSDFRYTYPNSDEVEYTVVVFACEGTISSDQVIDEETKELRYFSEEDFPGLELPFPLNVLYPKETNQPNQALQTTSASARV